MDIVCEHCGGFLEYSIQLQVQKYCSIQSSFARVLQVHPYESIANNNLLRSTKEASSSVRLHVGSLDLLFSKCILCYLLMLTRSKMKTLINDALSRDFVYIRVVPQFGKLYNLCYYVLLIFLSSPLRSLLMISDCSPTSDTRRKGFSAQFACPR